MASKFIDDFIRDAEDVLEEGYPERVPAYSLIAIAMALRDVVNLLDSISGQLASVTGVPNA